MPYYTVKFQALMIATLLLITVAGLSNADIPLADAKKYQGVTRDLYIFTLVEPTVDEDKLQIPPDIYSRSTMILKKGDTAKIHFYNLEPVETQEHHTFTITDKAFPNVNYDINAGERADFELKATKPGIYDYMCTYHMPTMSGQLVVLP